MSHALTPDGHAPPGQSPPIAVPAYLSALAPLGASNAPAADVTLTLRFRPNAAAPSLARNRVRWACALHDLAEHVVRNVAFVAGEMVAVSIRQVRAPLELDLFIAEEDVTVRVRDLGAGRFARSRPNSAGTNRSLQLVESVSQSWGISEEADGREIWAVIARRSLPE